MKKKSCDIIFELWGTNFVKMLRLPSAPSNKLFPSFSLLLRPPPSHLSTGVGESTSPRQARSPSYLFRSKKSNGQEEEGDPTGEEKRNYLFRTRKADSGPDGMRSQRSEKYLFR